MTCVTDGHEEFEPRRIPADERRALIVRAAGHAFARDGYAGARIEDIAAAADVTKPIVYRHFDSKKALYMALLEKHEADLPSFIERVAPEGLPLDQLVRSILEHWFDYVRENQHDWVMLFRDRSGDEEIQALRLRVNRPPRCDRGLHHGARRREDRRCADRAACRGAHERSRRSRALVDRQSGCVEGRAG